MRAPAPDFRAGFEGALEFAAFGPMTPISRLGGQGRVHAPTIVPAVLDADQVVVKLYRAVPGERARQVLTDMVGWRLRLDPAQRAGLDQVCAWPLAAVSATDTLVGIAMRDLRARFEVPFMMPSGRRERVLLALEHLLGGDGYLRQRHLGVTLDVRLRLWVAERIAAALALLHRHAIVASDIAPSNVLVSFAGTTPSVALIDCDSMVFRGRQALVPVETADWQMPAAFDEPPLTRAADAYKLGLVVLRLLARSHAERTLAPNTAHVPSELRPLLSRSLSADARNRPPAGEWVRALRVTLSDPDLVRRYPGPAAARHVTVAPPPAREAPPRAQIAPSSPYPRRGRRRSATVEAVHAVLMLGAILLVGLVLIRVFTLVASSAAGPVQRPVVYFARPGGFQPGSGPGLASGGP